MQLALCRSERDRRSRRDWKRGVRAANRDRNSKSDRSISRDDGLDDRRYHAFFNHRIWVSRKTRRALVNRTVRRMEQSETINHSSNVRRGGAELLFDKRKKHEVVLPGDECE